MVPGVLSEKTLLCNATGAYGLAVSEHAFALTMMLIKKLHLYAASRSRACWEDRGPVTSLSESTVLVVGLGDIGLCYALLVKAMGARVIGPELAKTIVTAWLASEFQGGGSQPKVDQMRALEKQSFESK